MRIFVTDMEQMVRFSTEVLGLTVTDRGQGATFKNEVSARISEASLANAFALMSRKAAMELTANDACMTHHQLALVSGRPKEVTFSTVDHGNAWSIYFKDPEGNTVEVYLDSPFVPQPRGDPLDLSKSDEEIIRATEAACRNDPGFMLREEFVRRQPESVS